MKVTLDPGSLADIRRYAKELEIVPKNIRIRHMRVAMNAWGGVVRDAIVARAPRELGLLRKSIKVKVKIPAASFNIKHHGKPPYMVVGPATKMGRFFRKTRRGTLVGAGAFNRLLRAQQKENIGLGLRAKEAALEAIRFSKDVADRSAHFRIPTRYAHLVEGGTRRGVKAVRFMAAGKAAGLGPGLQKFKAKMAEAVKDEAARMARLAARLHGAQARVASAAAAFARTEALRASARAFLGK